MSVVPTTTRRLTAGALSLAVLLPALTTLTAPSTHAAPHPTARDHTVDSHGPHSLVFREPDLRQSHAARDLPPKQSPDLLRRAHDRQTPTPKAAPPHLRDNTPGCRAEDFAARRGTELAAFVATSETTCVNTLFSLTGNLAKATFAEANMTALAQDLTRRSARYDGTDSTGVMRQILFLRAGYFVNYYRPADTGPYGTTLTAATRGALDAFFASPHAFDATAAAGDVLEEAVTLIDSSSQNTRYLWVVKKLLSGYGPAQAAHRSQKAATNKAYTVLFRGHQVPGFPEAVAADPSVLKLLKEFALTHVNLLATDDAYLTTNAGTELARFLNDAPVKAIAKTYVVELLKATNITGPGAGLWVSAAAMVQDADPDACADYGTCNLTTRLTAVTLPVQHRCDAHRTIRAQAMNARQLADTCASLIRQDSYVQGIFGTNTPVRNDHNESLEVVVFDSPADYSRYATALYGISTDNGGMYLEGDPADPKNQARFVAYRSEKSTDFAIWNLNHEYTHYLDGRYTMYGSFEENMKTPTIWWIEGIAEYVSYHYRGLTYDAAVQAAAARTYRLSTLFDTTYDHDQTRIYRWGYLAVRFMVEQHRAEMETVWSFYRTGDWAAARSYLKDSIGTAYDDEFNDWLDACAKGGCVVSAARH
ncbi:Microbial collagenase [Austwickia sp. TVS 96-490-7B]|uniref:collagenase n=1 Tax=Austwickia sp. TVS 96-490-7B TaxID=2830843 RepID=UPI001C57C933|nr:collagenase [Austwickia sp. TVS 96-490-7B]MBW3086271.1 Microbial collagenase [Austwickia sp. TVS 96-490-7B]